MGGIQAAFAQTPTESDAGSDDTYFTYTISNAGSTPSSGTITVEIAAPTNMAGSAEFTPDTVPAGWSSVSDGAGGYILTSPSTTVIAPGAIVSIVMYHYTGDTLPTLGRSFRAEIQDGSGGDSATPNNSARKDTVVVGG
jgi:hypothetical protein